MKKKCCLLILIMVLSMSLCACAQPQTAPPDDVFDKVYAFDSCLYMIPVSSYYPWGGTGQRYRIGCDGITIIDEESGEALETHATNTPSYTKLDGKAWNDLFSGFEPVDISAYTEAYQYAFADEYRLYLMDDEVWLGKLAQDGSLWSLYRLKPCSD